MCSMRPSKSSSENSRSSDSLNLTSRNRFPLPDPWQNNPEKWPERDELTAVLGDFFDAAISEDAAEYLARYCIQIRDWEDK